MYHINTFKRELVHTNAYELQPSLSERVIVDGHGCHTVLHCGVKAKETQHKIPMLNWLPKLHTKKPLKQDLLLILVLVRQQNFLNYQPRVLQLLKHVIKYCERYMRNLVKIYFGLLKNQMKF